MKRLWRKTPMLHARPLLLALLIACGPATDGDVYDVTGVVQAVYAEQAQIKIAHDDIPGLMPAMTMNFDVASPDQLRGVLPGSRVRFRLERTEASLRVLSLTVIGLPAEGEAGLSGPGIPEAPEVAPGFRLIDQDGQERALSDLRGQAVLIDFIFTHCPGPCPILTSAHVDLQRGLPQELVPRTHFVSVSIDPERDTPERLRAYALERGADLARWWFLTGEPEAVRDVLHAYHIGSVRKANGDFDHLVASFLIDPEGRIVRRYLGLDHRKEQIVADLSEALGLGAPASDAG
jgi:protein SCO1/2